MATRLQIVDGSDEFQTDELQVAYAFLEQAPSDTKRLMLYKLYNMVRTYNAVTLRHNEVVSRLASLQLFHAINAATISPIFNTSFKEQESSSLKSTSNKYKSATTDVSLNLPENDFQTVFKQLRETGHFTFTLDNETACSLKPESYMKNWFDVRYASVRVYFLGAVKPDHPASYPTAVINTTIKSLGSSKVLDPKGECHKFYFPAISISFSYSYNTKVLKYEMSITDLKPHSSVIVNNTFDFGLEEDHDHDVYVQAPFTTWHVDLDEVYSNEKLAKDPSLRIR